MKDSVKTSIYTAETESSRLQTSVIAVREALRQLDNETDRAAADIKAEMDGLRAEIAERENALLKRLEIVSERKRQALTGQLATLSETIEMFHWSKEVASNLLSDTDDGSDDRSAYLVGASGAIAKQTVEVVERIKSLALEPLCDPTIAVSFNFAELDAIRLNLPVLGCIQVSEELDGGGPGGGSAMGIDDSKDPELTLYHSRKKSAKYLVQPAACAPQILFSIKAE